MVVVPGIHGIFSTCLLASAPSGAESDSYVIDSGSMILGMHGTL